MKGAAKERVSEMVKDGCSEISCDKVVCVYVCVCVFEVDLITLRREKRRRRREEQKGEEATRAPVGRSVMTVTSQSSPRCIHAEQFALFLYQSID